MSLGGFTRKRHLGFSAIAHVVWGGALALVHVTRPCHSPSEACPRRRKVPGPASLVRVTWAPWRGRASFEGAHSLLCMSLARVRRPPSSPSTARHAIEKIPLHGSRRICKNECHRRPRKRSIEMSLCSLNDHAHIRVTPQKKNKKQVAF